MHFLRSIRNSMNRHRTATLVVVGVVLFVINFASYVATNKYIQPVIDNYMNNLVRPYQNSMEQKAQEQSARPPVMNSPDPSALEVKVWDPSMTSPYGQDADANNAYAEVPQTNPE